MGVVAISVIWPIFDDQAFVSPTHWGSIWNVALVGPVLFEDKTFKEFSLYEWQVTPGAGQFFTQGYSLNNLGRD